MEINISYHTPPGLFDPDKRPPGHVLDPIIRSAAQFASRVLEQAGVPHRVRRIDGRDDTEADQRFYGTVIIPGGDAGECEPIPYGWTTGVPGHESCWHGFNTFRTKTGTGTGEEPAPGQAAAATVVETWREMGLITSFADSCAPGQEKNDPGRAGTQPDGAAGTQEARP